MTKKALKIFTASAVAASVVTPVASANTTFNDITPSNSHYEAVQSLVERGIINGFEDGTFRPNATLTRGQAAKILANALNLDTSSTTQKFSDVTSKSGYIGAINALVEAGIINGYKDNTFKPNAPLTRGQMSKILVNAFKLEKATELTHSFQDVSSANGYNYDIQTLVNYEITQGTTSTTYAPTEAVKRGQMATFVVRAEKANANETVTKEVTLQVNAVEGNTLQTTEGEFSFDASFANVLNEANNAALANSVIKAIVKDNQITAINLLQINASGTAEKAIVLDGQLGKFDGSIAITGNYVKVKNLEVTKNIQAGGVNQKSLTFIDVQVNGKFDVVAEHDRFASLTPVANTETAVSYRFENSKVAQMNITRNLVGVALDSSSTVAKMEIGPNVKELNLEGKIGELVLATLSELKLTGNATIDTLKLTNSAAKITLPPNTKIANLILPAGVDAASVIANYDAVRGNISTVNGSSSAGSSGSSTGSSDWTTGDSSNGGQEVTPPTPVDPKPEKPQLPETPLDKGNEQLDQEKPVAPIGNYVTATVSEIIVTTADSGNIATGDSSTVTSTDTVKIKLSDGQTYFVAQHLADFFQSNSLALSGAKLTVIENNGRIEAIKDLELIAVTAPVTLLDGGAITIYGNLKVLNNQITSLSNITVTGNVILAADRTQNIEIARSTVFGKVEFETAKALAKRSMLAGLTQVAAATTRIKITFTDSTVAIIEVRKEDVELHTGGTSEVANIRLFANTDITSDLTDGKILPKIVIGQGVTSVQLNASIANVVIESDENVIVGGEGNFGNVVVNTSKEVAINTVGTIGNLDIKKNEPNVKIGEEVKSIDTVTTVLPVEEVFQNYDDLKGKVGQVVLPNIEFFAAELIHDYQQLGNYTIKLAGVGNYTVKYSLVDFAGHWNLPEIERNKDKAPADAKTYQVGEKIFIPANKAIIVYTVDNAGIIKDYKKDFRYGDSIRFTATETGTKIESTFDVNEGSKVSDVYNGIFSFSLGNPVVYLGTSTIENYTWQKEGNLVSFVVPGTDKFTLAEEDKAQTYFNFAGNDRKIASHGYISSLGGKKATALKVIKEIYNRSINDPAPADMLAGPINLAFYAELNMKDNIADRSNGEQYRSVVEKATTLEQLYDLIVEVNKNNKQ